MATNTLAQVLQEADDNGLLETLSHIMQRGDMADAWMAFLTGLRNVADRDINRPAQQPDPTKSGCRANYRGNMPYEE